MRTRNRVAATFLCLASCMDREDSTAGATALSQHHKTINAKRNAHNYVVSKQAACRNSTTRMQHYTCVWNRLLYRCRGAMCDAECCGEFNLTTSGMPQLAEHLRSATLGPESVLDCDSDAFVDREPLQAACRTQPNTCNGTHVRERFEMFIHPMYRTCNLRCAASSPPS